MVVSIIIPVFNREKLVARAIRSALDQKDIINSNYEIIVINDGSEDNSENEILKFKEHITYIKNRKNLGLPASRNKGIIAAKGRYIFNLDSDDYIHPKTLSVFLTAFELIPDASCIASNYVYTDVNDNKSNPISFKKKPIACSIMFKRQLLLDIGLYDEHFKVHEEKDLWFRIKEKKFKIIYLNLPLYRYFKHDDSLSNSDKSDHFINLLKNKYDDI